MVTTKCILICYKYRSQWSSAWLPFYEDVRTRQSRVSSLRICNVFMSRYLLYSNKYTLFNDSYFFFAESQTSTNTWCYYIGIAALICISLNVFIVWYRRRRYKYEVLKRQIATTPELDPEQVSLRSAEPRT